MFEYFYYDSEYKKVINESINRCLLEFADMRFTVYRENIESSEPINNDQELIQRVKEEQ